MAADIFEIARNGTPQDLIICIAKEMLPKWKSYFEKAAVVKAARHSKRKAEEEILASVDVPWLQKKTKVEWIPKETPTGLEAPALRNAPESPINMSDRLEGEKDLSGKEREASEGNGGEEEVQTEEVPENSPHSSSRSQTPQDDTDCSTDPIDSCKRNSRISPLLLLCKSEDPELEAFCRKKLLNFLNMRDKYNRNALHLAAFSGNIEMIRLLSSPDPSIGPIIPIYSAARDNMQAIHFAASAGNTAAVKECIKFGARVNAATAKGSKTALYFAQQKKHEDTIAYLTKKGGRLGLDSKMANDKDFQEFLESTKKVMGKGQTEDSNAGL